MYNLTVADTPEFFANDILVHNCDEQAKWFNLRHVDVQGGSAWDNALMGLRRGTNPRWVITTTPRPIPVLKDLLARAAADPGKIVVTRGTSYDNRRNLAPSFFADTLKIYEGTRLGRQEIMGELLEDVPGALWTVEMLTRPGFRNYNPPTFTRVVIAVDPAVTSGEDADETGIVVTARDEVGQGYVLMDRSMRGRPHEWATMAVAMYREWKADGVICESNNGGEMVEMTVHTIDPQVPVKLVTASRGKRTRAEPVSALYEKNAIMHCGYFPALEEEMQNWIPDMGMDSPSRMDAMVWGLTELLLEQQRVFRIL